MSLLQTIHGELRWLVALAALAVLIRFVIGWLGRRDFTDLDRRLMTVYAMVLSLNWLLGLILLIWAGISQGQWPGYRWEHALTMTLAVAIASQSRRFAGGDDAPRFRNNLVLVVLSLVLVFLGVVRLRGGWLV